MENHTLLEICVSSQQSSCADFPTFPQLFPSCRQVMWYPFKEALNVYPHSWALNSQQQHMLTPTPLTVSMLDHTAECTFLLWRGSPLDTAHPRPCRSSGRQRHVWGTAERDYWPGGRERKKGNSLLCHWEGEAATTSNSPPCPCDLSPLLCVHFLSAPLRKAGRAKDALKNRQKHLHML